MEETGGATAYGASLAGGGFDFYKFVRQPQTIVRVLSWIFSMVVFACITTEGYVNTAHSAEAKCVFNQNDSACHYAVGIGVIAFLACVAFLVLDAYLPFMSNAQERKYAVMADLGFSGVWTFLWFVCFCLLASQWARTHDISSIPEDAARATVAFSFFSIATWVRRAAVVFFSLNILQIFKGLFTLISRRNSFHKLSWHNISVVTSRRIPPLVEHALQKTSQNNPALIVTIM
uniref:Synaptogyrin 2b n=1 Tax=Mastacembelus armatus TaxID=205130 RepID=A0A7N9AVD2_9TELE